MWIEQGGYNTHGREKNDYFQSFIILFIFDVWNSANWIWFLDVFDLDNIFIWLSYIE